MFEEFGFYIFSVLSIGFFIIAVYSRNVLHALSSMAAGMVFLAGLYFLLDAQFVGAIQIIVYSGSVLGIYTFAVMFFDSSKQMKEKFKFAKFYLAVVVIGGILLVGAFAGYTHQGSLGKDAIVAGVNVTKQLGLVLFTKYMLAFEFIAILLLIALVAAVVLAAKRKMND